MRTYYLLFTALSIILFSCKNQDDPVPETTEVTINGENFSPTESSALKTGDGFFVVFIEGTKTITIRTNDTITGTYSILSQSLKSASTLKANLTYFDGSTMYKGNGGTFRITRKEGNLIAGIYNSEVISDKGLTLNIESGSFIDVKVTALLPNETAIQENLATCYSNLYEYIQLSYLFDAVYSNEISAPNSSWTEIYNHTQTLSTENEKVLNLWANAYEIIYKLNLILESTEYLTIAETDRNKINAQAKAIRAYLFYNLMVWFGEIPIELGIDESLIPRSPKSDVIAQIKNDAMGAASILPDKWQVDDQKRVTKSFALGLLARISLNSFKLPYSYPPQEDNSNYSDAINICEQIINSGVYSLSSNTNNFSVSNSEIIWGFEKGDNTEFNNFFTKGSYIPGMRLTEMYLIKTEASFRSGNTANALSMINILNARNGNQALTSITSDDIFQQWIAGLSKEGNGFIAFRRFEKALLLVQNHFEKLLLPVPNSILIKNPNLTQNVGY